jgi:hypothetical protein
MIWSPPCFLAVVVVDTVEEGGGRGVCHVGRHVGRDVPTTTPATLGGGEYLVTVSSSQGAMESYNILQVATTET